MQKFSLNVTPEEVLQINGAKIIYRNFSGKTGEYNEEGDRNFVWIIPSQEIADDLASHGWNVRVRDPKEEGDEPFFYLKIKIKVSKYGPHVYIKSGETHMDELNPEELHLLDKLTIDYVSMDVRPFDWEKAGKSGRAAYLNSICVVPTVDRFKKMMEEMNGQVPEGPCPDGDDE